MLGTEMIILECLLYWEICIISYMTTRSGEFRAPGNPLGRKYVSLTTELLYSITILMATHLVPNKKAINVNENTHTHAFNILAALR